MGALTLGVTYHQRIVRRRTETLAAGYFPRPAVINSGFGTHEGAGLTDLLVRFITDYAPQYIPAAASSFGHDHLKTYLEVHLPVQPAYVFVTRTPLLSTSHALNPDGAVSLQRPRQELCGEEGASRATNDQARQLAQSPGCPRPVPVAR